MAAAIEELAAQGPQPKERKVRAPRAQCSEGGSDAAPSRRSNRVDPEKKVSYKDDEYWKDTFKVRSKARGMHGPRVIMQTIHGNISSLGPLSWPHLN